MALGMFVICHDSYLLACLSWFLPHVICHGHCPSISVPFTPFHFCTLFPECSILRGEGDLMQTRIGSYIRVDLWMAIVVTSPTTPPPTYLCPRWRKPRDYSPNAHPNHNSPQFSRHCFLQGWRSALCRVNFFMQGERTKKDCRVRKFSFTK